MLRKRILWVEDEIVLNRIIMLEKKGFAVTHEESVDEALRRLIDNKEEFDVILLDLMMSCGERLKNHSNEYETGAVFLKYIRCQSINIPVIVITGNPEESVESKCRELEIKAYFSKPFSQARLEKTINSIIDEGK